MTLSTTYRWGHASLWALSLSMLATVSALFFTAPPIAPPEPRTPPSLSFTVTKKDAHKEIASQGGKKTKLYAPTAYLVFEHGKGTETLENVSGAVEETSGESRTFFANTAHCNFAENTLSSPLLTFTLDNVSSLKKSEWTAHDALLSFDENKLTVDAAYIEGGGAVSLFEENQK